MPTVSTILTPINTPEGGTFNPSQVLSSINSGLVYDVLEYATIRAQIDFPLDASIAGTISVQGSNDGESWSAMPQGAIDYSSGGLKEPIYVAGIRYVRFQVTATSGSVEFRLTVTGTTGDVLEVPTAVTTRGYYGVFTANADQSIGNATATAVLLDTTEEATGVSLGSPLSRVVVANAGTYNFQFSAQLRHTTGSTEHVSVWFRHNGTDIPRSNTDYAISGNNAAEVMAWNFV